MTLGFSDGAYNHAEGTRNAFGALSDDLVREGHPPMVSRSGDREPADQLRIWHERMTLTPGRRKVYGRKWWQGRLWYQIHPDAVGIPDTSNHEKRRSNDLRAPYNADTAAARRAKELAKRHSITREGENFRELWHWTFWGPLGTIGAPASAGGANTAPVPKEDDMIAARITDGNGVIHHAVIGDGRLRHLIDADDPEWVKDVVTADDRWTEIPIQRLPSMLRTYGCDLHIWDIRNGSFVVLDPLTGVVAPGMVWTAVNVLRSTVAQIKVTSEQTKAYLEQLAKAE